MSKFTLPVDKNLKETLPHGSLDFPVQIEINHYEKYYHHTISWHWHPEVEITVVLKGELCYEVPNNRYVMSAGNGIFVNSNILHTAYPTKKNGETISLSLLFSPAFLGDSPSGTLYKNFIQPVINCKELASFYLSEDVEWQKKVMEDAERIRELFDTKDFGFEMDSHILLWQIWRTININCRKILMEEHAVARQKISYERARLMLSYIQEHYGETVLIEDLMAAAHISRSECFRCFQQVIHKKPLEYLNQYRIEQAAALLSDQKLSISDISTSCGFNYLSYFGKRFREATGMTPLEYRKKSQMQ